MFSSNPALSTLLALAVTLALIWVGAKLLTIISPAGMKPGSFGQATSSSSTALIIESVTTIAPRRRVIVLRYGEQRLAVLTGGPQDISLGWLPAPGLPPLH